MRFCTKEHLPTPVFYLSPSLPCLNSLPVVLLSWMSLVGWKVTLAATRKVTTITYRRTISGNMMAMDGPERKPFRAEHHFSLQAAPCLAQQGLLLHAAPCMGESRGVRTAPPPKTARTFFSHPEEPGSASQDGGDAHQPAGVGAEPPPQLPP